MAIGTASFDVAALGLATLAFQSDSSGFVALFNYMAIVYGFVTDVVIFDKKHSLNELMAILTILVTATSVAAYKLKRNKSKPESDEMMSQSITEMSSNHNFDSINQPLISPSQHSNRQ